MPSCWFTALRVASLLWELTHCMLLNIFIFTDKLRTYWSCPPDQELSLRNKSHLPKFTQEYSDGASQTIPFPLCSSCLYQVSAGYCSPLCVCFLGPRLPSSCSARASQHSLAPLSATQSGEETVQEWLLIIIKLVFNVIIIQAQKPEFYWLIVPIFHYFFPWAAK